MVVRVVVVGVAGGVAAAAAVTGQGHQVAGVQAAHGGRIDERALRGVPQARVRALRVAVPVQVEARPPRADPHGRQAVPVLLRQGVQPKVGAQEPHAAPHQKASTAPRGVDYVRDGLNEFTRADLSEKLDDC